MRVVLFVVEPLGTGKVYRSLAIAETLKLLYPALAPTFVSGGSAARLLAQTGVFPVVTALEPLVVPAEQAQDLLSVRRSLAAAHGREIVRQARALAAERVVLDGLATAASSLRRAKIKVTLLTDDLWDLGRPMSWRSRCSAAVLRRSAVGSSQQRFFLGEPSYLTTPEVRIWARRFFRFSGPISGIARLQRSECATLRDDLGIGAGQLLVITAGGSAMGAEVFNQALEAARDLQQKQSDLWVLACSGPELTRPEPGPRLLTFDVVPELYRYLATADACISCAGLSSLSECAGLRLPTLVLPIPGRQEQRLQARYFAARHGLQELGEGEISATAIREALPALLAAKPPETNDFPDADAQKRNAHYIADLIAEALGRRRPNIPPRPL